MTFPSAKMTVVTEEPILAALRFRVVLARWPQLMRQYLTEPLLIPPELCTHKIPGVQRSRWRGTHNLKVSAWRLVVLEPRQAKSDLKLVLSPTKSMPECIDR